MHKTVYPAQVLSDKGDEGMRKGRRTGALLTALVMLGSLMSGCAGKPTGSTPGKQRAENSAPDNSTPEEWLPGGLYEDPEFERQDADVVEADVVLPGGSPSGHRRKTDRTDTVFGGEPFRSDQSAGGLCGLQ